MRARRALRSFPSSIHALVPAIELAQEDLFEGPPVVVLEVDELVALAKVGGDLSAAHGRAWGIHAPVFDDEIPLGNVEVRAEARDLGLVDILDADCVEKIRDAPLGLAGHALALGAHLRAHLHPALPRPFLAAQRGKAAP